MGKRDKERRDLKKEKEGGKGGEGEGGKREEKMRKRWEV